MVCVMLFCMYKPWMTLCINSSNTLDDDIPSKELKHQQSGLVFLLGKFEVLPLWFQVVCDSTWYYPLIIFTNSIQFKPQNLRWWPFSLGFPVFLVMLSQRKIPYGIDILLYRPVLKPVFCYWICQNWTWIIRSVQNDLGRSILGVIDA